MGKKRGFLHNEEYREKMFENEVMWKAGAYTVCICSEQPYEITNTFAAIC